MVAKKEENADDDTSLNTNPVPVWAFASTRTDPNMRTGMSITGYGNLCILVPTYIQNHAH
jgi:hypothetical protein